MTDKNPEAVELQEAITSRGFVLVPDHVSLGDEVDCACEHITRHQARTAINRFIAKYKQTDLPANKRQAEQQGMDVEKEIWLWEFIGEDGEERNVWAESEPRLGLGEPGYVKNLRKVKIGLIGEGK